MVKNIYFVLQIVLTSGNLDSAKKILKSHLYNSYKIKLEWMLLASKENVLKIRLINFCLVFVYSFDGSKFNYIEKKTIDCVINTEYGGIIKGSKFDEMFVEY